ncbi:MAG: RagB/SusD family nutrient uptake outer membrane protein, partial [Prolixibacteraceae bacterium]
MKNWAAFIISISFIFLISCSEENLNPSLKQDKLLHENIRNFEELQGIAWGMYDQLTAVPYYGRNYIIYGEVRADNCWVNGNTGRFLTVAKMAVSPDRNYSTNTWAEIYKVIASANILINQEPELIEGNVETIRHIIGQAYVVRALAHFDLLKLYGRQHAGGELGIPYITSYASSYSGEQIAPTRDDVQQNKQAILADIETGLAMMPEELNDPSKQFITTHAANALKARVALYFNDWATAKSAAQSVVNSGEFSIAEAEEYAESWKTDAAANSIFELACSASDNNDFNSL